MSLKDFAFGVAFGILITLGALFCFSAAATLVAG